MWRMLASTAPLTCCVSFKSMKLWQVLFLSMSWVLFYCTKQTGIKVPSGGRSHSGLWSHHKSGADIKTSVNEREKVESIQGLHNNSQLLHFFVCFFDQSGVVEHRQYMSAFFFCQPQNKIHVSLGLVAYSRLFCSEAKVGPAGWWWMETQISHDKQHQWTICVVGVSLWQGRKSAVCMLLTFKHLHCQRSYHLSKAVIYTEIRLWPDYSWWRALKRHW